MKIDLYFGFFCFFITDFYFLKIGFFFELIVFYFLRFKQGMKIDLNKIKCSTVFHY